MKKKKKDQADGDMGSDDELQEEPLTVTDGGIINGGWWNHQLYKIWKR